MFEKLTAKDCLRLGVTVAAPLCALALLDRMGYLAPRYFPVFCVIMNVATAGLLIVADRRKRPTRSWVKVCLKIAVVSVVAWSVAGLLWLYGAPLGNPWLFDAPLGITLGAALFMGGLFASVAWIDKDTD
jgi:hypothetical protein